MRMASARREALILWIQAFQPAFKVLVNLIKSPFDKFILGVAAILIEELLAVANDVLREVVAFLKRSPGLYEAHPGLAWVGL